MTIISFEARAKRHRAGLAVAWPASPTILSTIEDFTDGLFGRGLRPRGVDCYVRDLRKFVVFLGGEPTLADITTPAIVRFQGMMGRKQLAASTISQRLSAIRAHVRWSLQIGLRHDDPTLGVVWPERDEEVPTPLTPAELAQLRRILRRPVPPRMTANQRRRWVRNVLTMRVFLYTAARLSEVANLYWRDVNFEADTITIRGKSPKGSRKTGAKGGKDRVVPLHPRLRQEFLRVPEEERRADRAIICNRDGSAMQGKSIAHFFEIWLNDLGLRIHAHQLRHTAATLMLQAGADIRKIQEVLGHKRLDTTKRYLMLDMTGKREAIERLPDDF